MERLVGLALLPVIVAAGLARRADAQAPGIDVDPVVALAITGVALAGTLAVGLAVPVPEHDAHTLGEDAGERFGFDEVARGRWSLHAHGLSNATLVGALALPAVAHLAMPEPGGPEALLVYGEAMSTTLLLNTVVKRVAQRRRPYSYGAEGLIRSRVEGSDAYLSFYSGHSATSFASATVGALTMALRSDSLEARAYVWSLGMASATATAVLRVRAGRHYPTDVLVGMIAGVGMGVLFPALHAGGTLELRGEEILAAAGGVAGGVLFALLWPLDVPGTAPVSVGPADRDGGLLARLTLDW